MIGQPVEHDNFPPFGLNVRHHMTDSQIDFGF